MLMLHAAAADAALILAAMLPLPDIFAIHWLR